MFKMPTPVLVRAAVAVLLAASALVLALRRAPEAPPTAAPPPPDLGHISAELDRCVDSILVDFRVEKNLWRKRTLDIPGTAFTRTERKVLANVRFPAVLLNSALNRMAQETFGGRAVGTENSKEGTISIHIEVAGIILQTVILRK